MSTVRDLIKGSLRDLGAIASGETPTADEQADAFLALNQMLAIWSTKKLLCIAIVREEIQLVVSQAAYTMGVSVSASLNTARPMEVMDALVQIVGSNPLNELPVKVINQHEFAEQTVKTTESSIPQFLYPEGTNPLETLRLWPVPSAANKLIVYSRKPITAFVAVSDTVTLPPGWDDAIQKNLAKRLQSQYGKTLSPDYLQDSREALADIKRANLKPTYLECDSGVLGRARSGNILTGDSN